ncbi:MAG TPA: metallophosphoesterase [Tetragenococcus sp.]|nr:metallophosphoesterase [Tetragenococcus sp.]
MQPYVYVISDIHGEINLFKKLLKHYDQNLHQLVLIGDLNDRGQNSKECFLLGKKLVEEKNAIYLRGNHEEYLLQFLVEPVENYDAYLQNGGKETLESLLFRGCCEEYSASEIALTIRSYYADLVDFLTKRPLYFEWDKYVFVHAGVDLNKRDWKKTRDADFIWIREPFHRGKNNTGKTIVFGHTITPMLYGDMQTTDLWRSDNKIGIDGGAVFGGSVHGVVFDKKGIVQDIEYQNLKGAWQPDF